MHEKRKMAMTNLQEKLFILDPVLGAVLKEHKHICSEMGKLKFFNMGGAPEVQELKQFSQTQQENRTRIQD